MAKEFGFDANDDPARGLEALEGAEARIGQTPPGTESDRADHRIPLLPESTRGTRMSGSLLIRADCLRWPGFRGDLRGHAVVTDPPYDVAIRPQGHT